MKLGFLVLLSYGFLTQSNIIKIKKYSQIKVLNLIEEATAETLLMWFDSQGLKDDNFCQIALCWQ